MNTLVVDSKNFEGNGGGVRSRGAHLTGMVLTSSDRVYKWAKNTDTSRTYLRDPLRNPSFVTARRSVASSVAMTTALLGTHFLPNVDLMSSLQDTEKLSLSLGGITGEPAPQGETAFKNVTLTDTFAWPGQVNVQQSAPDIKYLFVPTPVQRERISKLANVLQILRVGTLVSYEGEDDEVVLEAGPTTRSITFLLQKQHTVALFRNGDDADFSSISAEEFGVDPSTHEVVQIADRYLTALNGNRRS